MCPILIVTAAPTPMHLSRRIFWRLAVFFGKTINEKYSEQNESIGAKYTYVSDALSDTYLLFIFYRLSFEV